jgi:hypothetical protein
MPARAWGASDKSFRLSETGKLMLSAMPHCFAYLKRSAACGEPEQSARVLADQTDVP